MLAVCSKQPRKKYKDPSDIIVTKYETKTEAVDANTSMTKRIPKKVNVTRMVNETKKLIKQDTASKKIAELKDILLKEESR